MRTTAQRVEVWVGEDAEQVGVLDFAGRGRRMSSTFRYDERWLGGPHRFEISPDLPLRLSPHFHKPRGEHDSAFHFGIADAEPDGWGCRIITREHARRRRRSAKAADPAEGRALTPLDYLLGVDDVSRVGALRFRNAAGEFVRATEEGAPGVPPFLELADLLHASRAVEQGTETARDLRYLLGRGTSLGGIRPKCSVEDSDGSLSIGKFPSVHDDRAVTKGEVLALRLAALAGIDSAKARIVYADGVPIVLVRRFDRVAGGRVPYVSAATILLASRDSDHAYSEIAERILSVAPDAKRDLAELWRRIVFNMLITNVDDHLKNHGFLHVAHGQWRLAPAFDLNPFPDKDRELKTWLTEESGPTGSIADALHAAPYFHLDRDAALQIVSQVCRAVTRWRDVAQTREIGMTSRECEVFAPAFEHEGIEEARRELGL